uniref:uncharacterized protein LOC114677747 n=1 Tax=Macaca mulatta TaxID=9544 RepID=UPI0010A269C2|nr:uncharacterized protein LOC114677747 [Macaca mulatta]
MTQAAVGETWPGMCAPGSGWDIGTGRSLVPFPVRDVGIPPFRVQLQLPSCDCGLRHQRTLEGLGNAPVPAGSQVPVPTSWPLPTPGDCSDFGAKLWTIRGTLMTQTQANSSRRREDLPAERRYSLWVSSLLKAEQTMGRPACSEELPTVMKSEERRAPFHFYNSFSEWEQESDSQEKEIPKVNHIFRTPENELCFSEGLQFQQGMEMLQERKHTDHRAEMVGAQKDGETVAHRNSLPTRSWNI